MCIAMACPGRAEGHSKAVEFSSEIGISLQVRTTNESNHEAYAHTHIHTHGVWLVPLLGHEALRTGYGSRSSFCPFLTGGFHS